MNSTDKAVVKAIKLVGLTELAKRIDATPSQLSNWRSRGAPTDKCTAIEQATDGRVTRKDLRPDDWESIWPELAEDTNRRVDDKTH
jgi:DNA-binding transcriptional regulator YdaS (Cro superfamily)